MKELFTTIFTLLTFVTFGQKTPEPKDYLKSINKPVWKSKANLLPDDCYYSNFYHYDSVLVAIISKDRGDNGIFDIKMLALNTNTGKIIWESKESFAHVEFHLNYAIYQAVDKLIYLDIYTGKEKWNIGKDDCVLYSPYFTDGKIYLAANRLKWNNSAGNNLFTAKDTGNINGSIIIDEKTGKELTSSSNIGHEQSWGGIYAHDKVVFFQSHRAISAFDMESKKELWRLKKAHDPARPYYEKLSGLKDTIVQYSFICGLSDTLILSRKASSVNYTIAEEKIIAVNLKTGRIIKEFFASDLNSYLLDYHYVQTRTIGNNLYFIKRDSLSNAKSYNGHANYSLVCIDLRSLMQKWEYNLSPDGKKFDVRDMDTHLYADSTTILFSDIESLLSFSPETGALLWNKTMKDASIEDVTFTDNFITCSVYDGNKDYTVNTIVIDKNNYTKDTYIKNASRITIIEEKNGDMYIVDKNDCILKLTKNAP
jgi:outer membrane protein assembly factor BamB